MIIRSVRALGISGVSLASALHAAGRSPSAGFATAIPAASSTFPASGHHLAPDLGQAVRDHDVTVLYGSHSGTSQHLAHRLARELRWRLEINAVSASLDAFDSFDLTNVPSNKVAVFFMSSYGNGGPTRNAESFWESVFGLNDPKGLTGLNYSVFGRGSSVYATYNFAAIQLNEQLQKLGATEFSPYGQSDKLSESQEDDYFVWKEALVSQLKQHLGVEEHSYLYKPSVDMREIPAAPDKKPWPKPSEAERLHSLSLLSPDGLKPHYVPAEIAPKADRDGRVFLHGSFDISKTPLEYHTGDYVVVWPENAPTEVDTFLDAFGLTSKRDVSVIINSKWKATYAEIVRHFVGINGPVSRELLRAVSDFAPDQETKDRAAALVSDTPSFHAATSKYVNIGRLMLKLSLNKPWPVPPTFLLDSIPPLVPRYFSGSSSSLEEPHSVSLTAVVEKHNGFNGVATSYLHSMAGLNDARVAISIAESGFKLPNDPSVPVVLTGIGTGIAPYRGFVRERQFLAEHGQNVGDIFMFFGVRNPESLLYKNLFESSKHVYLYPAFSRTDDKQYIQDQLLSHKDLVWDLVSSNAVFYVCGSLTKLRRNVRNTLAAIIAERKKLTPTEGQAEFKKLKKTGRLYVDMW